MTAPAAIAARSADAGGIAAVAAVAANARRDDAGAAIAGGRDRAGRRDRHRSADSAVAAAASVARHIGVTTPAAIAAPRRDDNARGVDGDDRAGTADHGIGAGLRIAQVEIVAGVAVVSRRGPDSDAAVVAIAAVIGAGDEAQSGCPGPRRDIDAQGVGVQRRDAGAVVIRAAGNIARTSNGGIAGRRRRRRRPGQAGKDEQGREQSARRSVCNAQDVPLFQPYQMRKSNQNGYIRAGLTSAGKARCLNARKGGAEAGAMLPARNRGRRQSSQ